jgi:hypothetical protein
MRTAIVISLAMALAACGGPLLGAELEDRKICVAMKSATVNGLHIDPVLYASAGDQTASWAGDFNLADHIAGVDKKGTTGNINVLSFTVSTTTQAAMDAITSADVDVYPTGDASAASRFMSYTKAADSYKCDAAGTCTMNMKLDQNLDIFKLVKSGSVSYQVAFKGKPPNDDWTATVETCMSVKLTIDALEAMKN